MKRADCIIGEEERQAFGKRRETRRMKERSKRKIESGCGGELRDGIFVTLRSARGC